MSAHGLYRKIFDCFHYNYYPHYLTWKHRLEILFNSGFKFFDFIFSPRGNWRIFDHAMRWCVLSVYSVVIVRKNIAFRDLRIDNC